MVCQLSASTRPSRNTQFLLKFACGLCRRCCSLVNLFLSYGACYISHVASVIWLWPSSVRNTSSIESFLHLGQMMSFSKTGRIPSSEREISPTSQSNSRRHFFTFEVNLHIAVVLLYSISLSFSSSSWSWLGFLDLVSGDQFQIRTILMDDLPAQFFSFLWWNTVSHH